MEDRALIKFPVGHASTEEADEEGEVTPAPGRWIETAVLFAALGATAWSVLRPFGRTSYARAIRTLGGLLLLLVIGFVLILQLKS
jgi:hypothetical protein